MEPNKLTNKHEIKVEGEWYRIIWVSLDTYVIIGINKYGIERRITSWMGKEMRRIT